LAIQCRYRFLSLFLAIVALASAGIVSQAGAQTPTEEEATATEETAPTEGEATEPPAEDTPGEAEPTEEGESTTPEDGAPATGTRIVATAPGEELDQDEVFEVDVSVEDVEGLAAFSFTLAWDPDKVSFQSADAIGMVLSEGPRSALVNCDEARVADDGGSVAVACVTGGSPVCLDGEEGASGSGTLARFTLTAEGSGEADIRFSDSRLISDDIEPCNPGEGVPIEIEHETVSTSVDIKGDGMNWLLIGGIALAVIAIAGAGLFAITRMRQQGSEA
jgi:hypothetical protein